MISLDTQTDLMSAQSIVVAQGSAQVGVPLLSPEDGN